jgi:hypothetical protein
MRINTKRHLSPRIAPTKHIRGGENGSKRKSKEQYYKRSFKAKSPDQY